MAEEDLTVDLGRWAGLKYTEQVRGTFPLSHWVSKDLSSICPEAESQGVGQHAGHSKERSRNQV